MTGFSNKLPSTQLTELKMSKASSYTRSFKGPKPTLQNNMLSSADIKLFLPHASSHRIIEPCVYSLVKVFKQGGHETE